MVADSMSRVSMDNVSHVKKDKMELDRDVHSYPEWVSDKKIHQNGVSLSFMIHSHMFLLILSLSNILNPS